LSNFPHAFSSRCLHNHALGKSRFHRANATNQQELTERVHTISHRVAGFLERDEENGYLNLEEGDEDPMQQVLGCSVSYRITIGPQHGHKVFTLQGVPAWEDDDRFAKVVKETGLVRASCPLPFGPVEAVQNRS
jgi:hypothetical protein